MTSVLVASVHGDADRAGLQGITGNIVSNEIVKGDRTVSLVLQPNVQQKSPAAMAITGNVLLGGVKLPVRPFAAPLNAWDVLNTVTAYLG